MVSGETCQGDSVITKKLRAAAFVAMAALLAGGVLACQPDPIDPGPGEDNNGNNGNNGTPDGGNDGGPDGGNNGIEPDGGDVGEPDTPPLECPDFCDEIDFCDLGPDDIPQVTECCNVCPQYCNPNPECTCGDGTCSPENGENCSTCPDDCGPCDDNTPQGESCMSCHNGSDYNDYAGPGLSNPHPFPPQGNVRCTGCHGGAGDGAGKIGSHVPNPPEIGTDEILQNDAIAYFNRLTLSGIDYLGGRGPNDPYNSPDRPGEQFTNLEYLQFINPGDLRVVAAGKGCGANGCHGDEQGTWVPASVIGTTNGIFSSTRFGYGVDNRISEYRGRNMDGDSLSDSSPRAVQNPAFAQANRDIGEVGRLQQQPEKAQYGPNGEMRDNGIYDANTLANHIINANQDPQRPNRVRYNSPLETLIDEQINITCGDCHLYSAGANNRYADFRSSGCTSCHMEYSYDGRSRSGDPNVDRLEPADPDAIAAPERAHVESHQIRNVAKFLNNGTFVRGISDRACVGCHQGSNRTVLQFWGVRLDQNQDLTNNFQYPANPDDFDDAANDDRLYDPAVANNTFNGREAAQHIVYEDYDADQLDDTPPDIHYERGMGCIDCHGSWDLHGGTKGNADSGKIRSRQDQAVAIRCESCHGSTGDYAAYSPCTDYEGNQTDCGTDFEGNSLRHVSRDANGDYWLVSRVNGQRHYIPQTKDVVVQNNKRNPLTQRLLYNPKASYAMGRADGNNQTGIGPIQTDPNLYQQGFSHTDTMDCSSCHASWTNNCIGCHLKNQYDVNPQNYFASNITGERILLFQANADFVYQTPVPFYLGVNSRGKITQISPAEKWFYRYQDFNNNESAVFAFSDRLGEGNNPDNGTRSPFPALAQNQMSAHSIRGKIDNNNEGPRYCVSCHYNVDQDPANNADYIAFAQAIFNNDYANVDHAVLQAAIGQNTGNQNNEPYWVHMVAGLGSGLFWFDATGCPVNPLDNNANRQYCPDGAPADNFDPNNVVYDLDRLVQLNGVPNAGTAHPRLSNRGTQRIGASNGEMSGPLGAQVLGKLVGDVNNNFAGARVLDSWIDADANAQGDAADYIQ